MDTLDQLTGHLSMRTFSERFNHKVLDSNFYLLSNYYPCNFVFRKQKYSNVEQAYQHVKAVLFNDRTSATDILSSDDPAAAKRLGFTIYGFKEDVWNAKRYELMMQIVKAKFEQNPELAAHFRATGKRTLAETGRHNFFVNVLASTHEDGPDMKQWTSQSKLSDI